MKLTDTQVPLVHELKGLGYSHSKIALMVGCSTSTVSILTNPEVAQRARKRNLLNQKSNPDRMVLKKVSNFACDDQRARLGQDPAQSCNQQGIYNKVSEFAKGRSLSEPFSYSEAISKIHNTEICYLSGRPINHEDTASFHLDHVVPRSKGGGNTLDNMGVAVKEANMAKSNLTVGEFMRLCVDVLEHNGYTVVKQGDV